MTMRATDWAKLLEPTSKSKRHFLEVSATAASVATCVTICSRIASPLEDEFRQIVIGVLAMPRTPSH